MDPRAAWLLGLLSMLAVFLYFHHKTGDLRYSFMIALLWGKVLATIYWLLGLDLPLFALYTYVEGYGYYPIVTITVNMAILATLLLTNALVYAWPELKRELGMQGELPGLPTSRRRG